MNPNRNVKSNGYLGGDTHRILDHHIQLMLKHLSSLQGVDFDVFEMLSEGHKGRILLMASMLCCEIESIYKMAIREQPAPASKEPLENTVPNACVFLEPATRLLS